MSSKRERREFSILMVDDHQLIRMALRALLSSISSICEIDEASTLEEGIQAAQKKDYSLVLLDLSLPDSTGLQTLSSFQQACAGSPVALLSGDGRIATMTLAMSSNIRGYIVKSQPPEVVSAAVVLMLAGGQYVPPDLYSAVSSPVVEFPAVGESLKAIHADENSERFERIREHLTPRLKEVFDLVITGRTNRDISDILGLTHGTVKNYVSLIFERLDVPNRSAVISYAMRSRVAEEEGSASSTLELLEDDDENTGFLN